MGQARPTVLYITGMMRSGSTLVGNILNEVDGVAHLGELHFLWKNLTLRTGSNSNCGCGEPLSACEFWAPVLAAVDMAEAGRVVAGQRASTRVRHTLARLIDPAGPGASAPVVRDRLAVYDAISAGGAIAVIVDSSKVPVEPVVLAATGAVDLRILHIVRSAHETVDSYRKPKAYIRPLSPLRTLGYWLSFNISAELIAARAGVPYMRMRYEDLVRDPEPAIRKILEFAGTAVESPIGPDRVVEFGINHTVTGNPDRFVRGRVTIADRGPGGNRGSVLEKVLVTVLTAPLALRYRYFTRR
ncbi:sulfotransferase [Nocardia sp. NPDC004340]